MRLEKRSDRFGEERYLTIGEMKTRIIVVIYTLREDCFRIISARKARKNEEKEYLKIRNSSTK